MIILSNFKNENENKESLTREYNKKLVEAYPFLFPRNVWTEKIPDDYNYDYTWYDSIPKGWRMAFGLELINELRNACVASNFLNEFRILEIKEKYNELRIYCCEYTEPIEQVLNKYETLAKKYCYVCGAPATRVTTTYILSYCDTHAPGCSISFKDFYKGE